MAFSRKSMAAAVAGSLSLAMLTGCPAQNPAVTTSPTPSSSTAPTTSPSTSASPTTTPTENPSGAPTVTPSVSPLKPTTVNGTVYDEAGAVVEGATVHIESLNSSNPFTTDIPVAGGVYVANNVPAGVQVRITATKDGWTSRSQVATLLPIENGVTNEFTFGGGAAKPGSGYFISKYPEIESTDPADDADNVDASKISYKLTLSDALDSNNQSRFAAALRLFAHPATNEEEASTSTLTTGTLTRAVQQGSRFLDNDNAATVTWDATGKVATLSFNAPLLASSTDKTQYDVGLFASSDKIVDASSNQLGTDDNGDLSNYPAANNLILNTFKKVSLPTLGTTDVASAGARWDATHNNTADFNVAKDDTDPTLTAIAVTGTSVELTFSEPVAAYDGTTTDPLNATVNGALGSSNYVFRIAKNSSDISGDTNIPGNTSTNTIASFNDAVTGQDFTFDSNATITWEISKSDPKVVRILSTVAGDRFPTDLHALKVRVNTGVQDPASNPVSTTNDANLKTGTF